MNTKIEKFFKQPWLSDYCTLAALWGLVALFCIYKIVHSGSIDADYLIFTHSSNVSRFGRRTGASGLSLQLKPQSCLHPRTLYAHLGTSHSVLARKGVADSRLCHPLVPLPAVLALPPQLALVALQELGAMDMETRRPVRRL